MKALSLAAGLAIALAGTACSEQVPAEPENVSAETAAPAAVETPAANTSSRSRFNLRIPGGEVAPAPQASGGFNLRTPDAPAPTNDIPMPAGSASSTLADVPEVAVPGLNNPATDIANRSRTEPREVNTEDDDDIIRLD
ncbi:MAG TPA: hypothetical protein EYG02_11115 [Henriciella marina]|uniref:hypothetical protein n=1 Tax=Henriciella sp. TaxID=1968823 RepID=UPI0017ACFD1E|nr:hypothetical protein [Henriciella sp.]HIG23877.1 hypothetical protein [Henriciella sp.]HIK65564.1 hypothetical protein [Henriciella marina]